MSDEPGLSADKDRASDAPLLPRWAMWLMLPGVVAPVLVFGFIIFAHRAHDVARCPYRQLSRRELAHVATVVEESRNCIGTVEEHRYVLERGGNRRVLGERRFDKAAFSSASYSWTANIDEQGEVHIEVHNAGHGDVRFREGTSEELRDEKKAR